MSGSAHKGDRHPTMPDLLNGAIHTLEEILIPEIESAWARSSALGLVGQLRYALARAERDSLAAQNAELAECVDGLLAEFAELRALVSEIEETGDPSWDLRERASHLLVHALDSETPAAQAIRRHLRPLVRAHAGQDLAETLPMFHAFLASGSLGSTG